MTGRERQQAKRDSWAASEMPAARVRLPIERMFSEEEFRQLRRGLIPERMEDKWFIYLDSDWLSCHRSWTGHCIYRARLERHGQRFRIAEAWANRDPAQYRGHATPEQEAVALNALIDSFLRRR